MVVVSFYFLRTKDSYFRLPRFHYNPRESHKIVITGLNDIPVLTGELGLDFELREAVVKCDGGKSDDYVCAQWPGMAQLSVKFHQEGPATCYNINWMPQTKDAVPYDCFDIPGAHWYGGAERAKDRWPIELESTTMTQYLGCDVGMFNFSVYGPVLDRYWISSSGVSLFVDDDVPLHVGINSEKLCLKADYDDSWYERPTSNELPRLKYSICVAEDVKVIHKFMASKHFKKPLGIPDERVLKEPIWSTWAIYKKNITQNKTLEFVNNINKYGFPASQVEIDDMYTPEYGDYTFSRNKFPDPFAMNKHIHKLGLKVISWVTPFANIDSTAFKTGLQKQVWVKDETGKVPGLMKWWQGTAGILDVSNPEAVEWYFTELANLHREGVDGFKFDAGEPSFLPPHYTTRKPLGNPNHYSTLFAEAIHAHADRNIELRVGYKTQHLPLLVRMMDKDSNWDYSRGLKTMIPTALIFGILGYPFILPDMVGGNAYSPNVSHVSVFPEKELFIRWLQLNVFLPSIQFSIPPWKYDQETIDITHKMMKLRKDYVNQKIIDLALECTKTGDPIIRPLWWISPKDSTTYTIDSEFLVGNDILVAPILDKGSNRRSIYLPQGNWKDMLRGIIRNGPQTLTNYEVSLSEVAYFERAH